MPVDHETVIVGAGQAGLAMSGHLRRRGRDHVVLERGQIGGRWRGDRWDSLAFQMPNWTLELPGMPYEGSDPEGFALHGEILRFIEAYAARIEAPVREGVEVTALRAREEADGYVLETSAGRVQALNVVIATGPFHHPVIPGCAAALPPEVFQTDALRYRAPDQLPEGAVLVVGSGSSGTQIADELLRAGRKVFLSLGRHRYAPRTYRGRDVIWWFDRLGRFDVPIDAFPDRRHPPPTVMTGVDGGYDLYPRLLGTQGAVLVGRVTAVAEGQVMLADDANRLLDEADRACGEFIAAADALAWTVGLPPDRGGTWPRAAGPVAPVPSLDIAAEGIAAVVWAVGYGTDHGWVKLPVLDAGGRPLHQRGVTACSGVYFLGLHWMHTFGSGLLSYVGQDAAWLADAIDRRARPA